MCTKCSSKVMCLSCNLKSNMKELCSQSSQQQLDMIIHKIVIQCLKISNEDVLFY